MFHHTYPATSMGTFWSGIFSKRSKYVVAMASAVRIRSLDRSVAVNNTLLKRSSWRLLGMERLAQFSVVLVAMLICLATSPWTPTDVRADGRDGGTWFAGHEGIGPSVFLQQPSSPPGVGQPFAGSSVPLGKDRVTGFAAMIRANDRSVGTVFARMAVVEWSRLLDLRRCALLFPFHVFW